MTLTGANMQQLTHTGAAQHPVATPSGKQIIYANAQGIAVMLPDGSASRQITSDGGTAPSYTAH